MRSYIGVGLLILSISFPVSLFGGFDVTQTLAEGRLCHILMENPQSYVDYVQDAFHYMILLPAVGLVFSIIAFIKEAIYPTEVLDKLWLSLTVFGGFFLFWGVYGLSWDLNSYSEDSRWANMYSLVNIAEPLRAVYTAVSVGYILWICAGILFMLSLIFKLMLRKKNALTIK
jgi:hypothetical protein